LVHERDIEPHIPVFDKSTRSDGTFSRADCRFDRQEDSFPPHPKPREHPTSSTASTR
jgi:hypothetical protein